MRSVIIFGNPGDFYLQSIEFISKRYQVIGYANSEDKNLDGMENFIPCSELNNYLNKASVLVVSFPTYREDTASLIFNAHVKKECILILYDEWNHFMLKKYPETYTVLAQFGEDDVIKTEERNARYLEVGVDDPIYINNTYHMHINGAKGFLVDANSDSIPLIEICRSGSLVYNKACVADEDISEVEFNITDIPGHSSLLSEWAEAVGGVKKRIKVPAVTINQLLAEIEEHIHVISIDVEGMDWQIMQSIDYNRFKPELVCAEINVPGIYEIEFMEEKGYVLGYNNHCNSIWYKRM